MNEPEPSSVPDAGACLPDLLEEQAARTPDRVAVASEQGDLTYRELHERANRLARHLQAMGIGPEVRVGLCTDRSPGMMVGLLGILKAGAAYLPLEPSQPADRLAWTLSDADVEVVVGQERLLAALPVRRLRTVQLERGEWLQQPPSPPPRPVLPDSAAYVIYTSGSTGHPKGVVNTHRAIRNRLLWMRERFPLRDDDHFLQKTPIGFDVSVWELFWHLIAGGRLVMSRPGGHKDPNYLVSAIERERITGIHFVPSMFRVFLATPGLRRCSSLRRVFCSGEALTPDLVRLFFQRFGEDGPELHNLYGPTEAAVEVSWWHCRPEDARAPVPIGHPLVNVHLPVLGPDLLPVPAGEAAELCIGGVQVARGYLDRPALTAERFVPDPLSAEPGGRLYRTGDLARERADGAIDFLGRIDHQIKIRGFRIEPGEVEAALLDFPGVREAAVLAREGAPGELRLVAYVAPAVPAEALRGFLAERLLDYMVPAAFVFLEALPLSTGGKLDRKALPAPGPDEDREVVAPRTPLESFLAGLFRELLGVGRVGVHDSFFTLGGTSISGALLINRLQEKLGEVCHLVTLFDHPTVERLAAFLAREYREAVERAWGATSLGDGPAGPSIGRRIDATRVEEFRSLIPPLPAPMERSAKKNPRALFVLAPPRSGTTLLRVLLGGSQKLFSPPELELLSFTSMAERRAALGERDGFWLEGVIRTVMEARECDVEEARRILAACEEEGWSTGRFYAELQSWIGDRLLVDKTTTYALSPSVLRQAEEVFEAPLYLHLVRHPYGMIRSFEEARLDQIFGRHAHGFTGRDLAELIWLLSHQNISEHLAGIPPERWLRVRFEDLVRQPESVMRGICSWLGIDFHPDMADPSPHESRRMTDGLHPGGRMLGDLKFHQHQGVESNVADRWREHHQEDFLGEPAWSQAALFGYERPERVERSSATPIRPLTREAGQAVPLSFAQERLWFLNRLHPDSPAYNSPRLYQVQGSLEVPLLAGALAEVVRRHEALRTLFGEEGGSPVQIVQPFSPPAVHVIDLCGLPEAARQTEADRRAQEEARRPFDLGRGPLLRTVLFLSGAEEATLLLCFHHIVTDGWSMGVLRRELGFLYRQLAEGRPAALPPLAVQYADFAVWQRTALAGGSLEAQLAAWRRRLASSPPVLELPTDHPRPEVQGFRGGVERLDLPSPDVHRLEQMGREQGATPIMVLAAALAALLSRLSGQPAFALGLPAAGRTRAELEGMIGFFVNSLVLHADLSGDPLFATAVHQMREECLFAYAHQEVPFERLVAELAPERTLSHTPFFQVMLALEEATVQLDLGPGLSASSREVTTGAAKFDLSLVVGRHAGGCTLRLEYAADLFEAETARRFLRCFHTLLEGALAGPGRVSELPLLSHAERGQALAAGSGHAVEVPGTPVHDLVREQARRQPGALAVASGAQRLTYAELDRRAGKLARLLRSHGLRSEGVAALLLERSPELVVAALAVLRTGGAYLPIDPALPAERVLHMLRDSGARALVTTEALRGGLSEAPLPEAAVFFLDRALPEDGNREELPPVETSGPDNLAYVIYTSGSTGLPKGTELRHAGLSNLVQWHRRAYGLTAEDRCALVAGPGFDASVWEIWPALASGASLHVPPADVVRTPPVLASWLAEQRISVAFLPTPLAEAVLAEPLSREMALRALLTGGDRLHRRPPRGLPFALVNHYGPTESTVVTTAAVVTPDGSGLPEIGVPIDNLRALVLDQGFQALPDGVPGELCVAGPGLARGYRGRPEITAERFVPDPFGEPGSRLYRTGDRVRRLSGGTLEFLGRIDRQVKIRGFRIELGEIEAALSGLPGVREAAVLVRPGENRLTACVALRGSAGTTPAVLREELRQGLALSLPEAMIPTAWVFLDTLPLTPNGKVDRRLLEGIEPLVEEAPDQAAGTPMEQLVAGLFAQMLGLGREPGVHGDFFHLGGHSLLATQLASRIREVCGVELGVAEIFQRATVKHLASRIEEAALQDGPRLPPPSRSERSTPAPLAFSQQSLWLLELLHPGTATYNIARECALPGRAEVPALAAALREVVRRHEALRTRFEVPAGAGEPMQHPAAVEELPDFLPLLDLGSLPPEARRAEADRLSQDAARQPYDLGRATLFRATLVRLGDEGDRLQLGMHHIVSDGWSVGVLLRELSALYRAALTGAASPLRELPLQYADFAVWQRRQLDHEALERRLGWWRQRLQGAPTVLELPPDRPRPTTPTYRGSNQRRPLGPELEETLAAFGRRHGATPFMTLLATFQSLLHRFSGQQDLVIGSPVANRQWGELEGLIGLFVNIVPLRGDLSGNPGLARLAGRVRDGALGAYAHQDLPFERIVEELQPPRDSSRSPLVQVIFALQQRLPDLVLGPGLAAPASEVTTATAKFDLAFFVEQEAAGLTAAVEYATDLFDAATMRHFLDSFQVLLEEALRDPEAPLATLPLLQAGERAEVLASSHGPAVTVPAAPVHLLVEEQARRRPEAPAIESEAARLTYGDLAARAGNLSRTLRSLGAGSETVVALLLERSPELVVAALAALRTGASYLPIDPALPAERVLYMLRDSGARVLVTTGSRLAELPEIPLGEHFVLRIEELLAGTAGEGILEPSEAAGPDALAYVIYTSGSTGLPKGTELRHAGLANLCSWHRRVYGLSPEDRCSMVAGPGFDASVWEIWPTLTAGASLHVPAADVARNPPALAVWLAERRISVAFLPTPVTDAFLGEPLPPGLSLRTLLTGGDRLRRRPPQEASFTLVNHYGPTESTVVTTAGAVSPDGEGAPFIGTAIDNLQALVLDRALQPLPDGVPGELCVAGPGLARGYRGQPEMTAAAFVPAPFGGPGERLYRTGDLVRRRTGGLIEFLGRIDRQVKIRGFRVELGEIEAALSRLPEVREAAVLVRPGESRLTACVVPREAERTGLREDLRQGLARSLPEPMIPSTWVFLDALPLTANGKVDRRALEHLEAADDSGEEAGQEARNPTQQILAGLFAQVLGLDRDPGIHEDFFQLGGHSLLAAQLVSRLRTTFGVEVPLRHLFEHPTVARLSERITAEGRPAAPPLLPRARGAEAELSFAQQRLWFLDRFESGSVAYNIPILFRIEGPGLRIAALAAAIDEVVRRHEVLRTIFRAAADGGAVQVVQPFAPWGLNLVDLSGLASASREPEAARLAAMEAESPFDLTRGPLVRTRLLRVDEERHDLLVTMHHILSDGWSMDVFAHEVTEIYRAFAEGRPSPLPPLPVQYADFALWQRDWLAGEVLRAELSWWRDRLAGLPPALTLPVDRPRPAVQSFRGTALRTAFPGELRSRLAALSRRRGATLFMTLLAAFDVLLHRYTGEEDLVVGTPVANRDRIEVEALIGFFVNTVVLRVDLGDDPGFLQLLERVRHAALESYAHQDIPFEKLVAELAPERDLSHTPIYQVWISLQETLPPALSLGPALSGLFREVRHDTSKFDLSLHMGRNEEGPLAACEYNTDIFDAATIERLLGHWRVLLEGIAAAPDGRISGLPLLSAAETEQLRADWNAEPAPPVTAPTLHALVAAQSRRTPEATALLCAGEAVTYAELTRRSGALAGQLRRLGVGPEVRVALCVNRTPELVIGLLGILESGAAVVPLDPGAPAERLSFVLEDAGAAALVTTTALAARLPAAGIPTLRFEEPIVGAAVTEAARLHPESLAYVIYTSGSTGRPKGVAVSHAAAVEHCETMARVYGLTSRDRVLQLASVAFDAALEEILPTLSVGAAVVLPGVTPWAPAELAGRVEEIGLTVLDLPAAYWQQWVRSGAAALARPANLRLVLVGGEEILVETARRWLDTPLAGVPLLNVYGPTEAVITATVHRVRAGHLGNGASAPIGGPLPGRSARVLDRWGEPQPVGVPGELHLGGVLARGYLGRPELTAERFVPDPFGDPSGPGGDRLYRTGDLVRRLADGVLEFLGRVDDQLKIRGFRIEPGEIEAVLAAHPTVAAAAVLPWRDGRELRLAGYVQSADGAIPAESLRDWLGERLPAYMVPAGIVVLDELPRTPNGKLDREALSRIVPVREGGGQAPRTPTEQELATLWSEILQVERVGADDDFFALGGHSLLAMQLVSRVRDQLGAELELRAVFEESTLERMAALLDRAERHVRRGPANRPAAAAEGAPLSFAQQRLWFMERFQPGSPAYNLPVLLRLDGPLAVPALAAAFTEIVRRHSVLRTVFAVEPRSGEPVQVALPPGLCELPVVDLSSLPAARRDAEAGRQIWDEQRRLFDLDRGPLLRLLLVRLGSARHELVATTHHIASDGWSIGILLRELHALYGAFASGRPCALPELPLQYSDYAAWERSRENEILADLAWWRERLAGEAPNLELPADFPRPPVQSLEGGAERIVLPATLTVGVQRLGQARGTTLFMTLLAAFQALLFRYTGQEDLWIGAPVANRGRGELEGLIGFFVNTLVLRIDLSGEPAFSELLRRVREAAQTAYAHQEVPFTRLVEELAPPRDLSRSPLFQILFSVHDQAGGPLELAPDLRLSSADVQTGTAKFDLSLACWQEEGGGLAVAAEYSTDLFKAATVRRMLGHFGTLLEAAVADPALRLPDLPLLTESEAAQIADWNGEAHRGNPSVETLHGLFEAQARRTPAAVALVHAGHALTYAELERRSARLAHRLRHLGVGPEVPVAVCLQRSADLVVALLGVLRAGGFYVPLDPAHPADRLAFLLEDSRCAVLVTQSALLPVLPSTAVPALLIEGLEGGAGELPENATEPGAPVERAAGPGHLAYLIYTSGSTGRPKAVAIEHRSAVTLVQWAREAFEAAELEGVLASTSVTFDLSVFEVFVPLATGGTVIVVENALALPALKAPGALPEGVEVRLINTVPSAIAELLRVDGLPDSVRTVNLAGEPLSRALADRIFERVATERLYNLYGPSEDTTYSTCAWVERSDPRPPAIGQPVDDTRAYVLDRRLRPLPVGIPGELCLAGAGLARGYLRRPELTAERFLPDPFAAEPGERMYRTGDLARRRPDGVLEYLGRLDHQVKIRGFRIELGEVEAALTSHPGVESAVALARQDRPGDQRLVAYVVGRGDQATAAELRRALRERLPEVMIPSAFVFLPALPLTPNGKVDRKALPAPDADRADLETAFVPPRTPLEQEAAAIWQAVLGVDRIGAHDSFWDLGGHSLLAMRLVSRIRDHFGVELSVRGIFEHPTLAGLAVRIEHELRGGTAGVTLPLLATASRSGGEPLSFPQQRLWLLDRLQPGSPAYNLPLRLRLDGPLAVPTLAASLTEIVRRHASLRTVFALDPVLGEPVQVILPPGPAALPMVDLSALPPRAREAETEKWLREEQRRPFDLGRGPLLRLVLVRQEPGHHHLSAALHHIVADGWSIDVLLRELRALYAAFSAGRPSPLAEPTLQYADFAAWQRRWLEGGALQEQLAWWSEYLAGGPPTLELPADFARPAVQTLRGGSEALVLGGMAGAVEGLGRRHGATLFMTLLAVFQTLLHRYTGQEDLWIGTPVANRNRSEIEGLIGFFVNTLVLRSSLAGGPTFAGLLERVRETALAAYAHQELPFERLVEELAPRRDLSRSPLFQVFFSVPSEASGPQELAPGLVLSQGEVETGTAKFDLSIGCWKEGSDLATAAEFSADLFEPVTARRILGHFRTLLEGALADPGARIQDLPLLTREEAAQIAGWNQEAHRGHPAGETLHGLFESQARRTPGAIAVVSAGRGLTYAELEHRSARLAHRLRRFGVGPEVPVAVCLQRSADLVVALLGVLRAGGFYVPLDPAHPAERLAFLLEDSRCAALLTQATLLPSLPPTASPVLLVDEEPAGEDCTIPEPLAEPGHLAYLIYTSGSTGLPKAVAIEHRSAVTLVRWAREVFDPAELSGVLASTSATFDLSVFEMFVPLATGGSVIVVENALALAALKEPGALPDGVAVSLINTVPSAIAELLRMEGLPTSVRTVNLAGEALPRALADRLWERAETERLYNLYGPSEDTTYSTFTLVERSGPRPPAIGRPVHGTSAYVLDRGLRPLPVGVPGELCLAGGGLARGYLRRPDLTAERFLADPFATTPGARMYRTGDLARRRPDGVLEYLGRLDHQVKIRGFRIELGEVEAVLAAHPGVEDAVAVARQDRTGDQRLVGYVVRRGEQATSAELRRALRERLPEIMVPSIFVFLEALPRTPNGKVDRKALPAPEIDRSDLETAFVAPRTPLEQEVAEIWQGVLGVDRIGAHDSFWDLGGHSLLATKVLLRIEESFGVDLPLQSLFATPTLGGLAALIGETLLADQGEEAGAFLAELEGLSDEEIRELLTRESEMQKQQELR
jgi:amino acid adenylation domain-containing protein